ncbi:MAG: transposase [bacterium]|nr:transposase [bacterium]
MTIKRSEFLRKAGRPRWGEADARAVLDALKESGRSVTEFAREHDLDPQRLWRWRSRLEGTKVTTESDVVSFVPLVVTGLERSAVVVARVGAVEVEVVDPAAVGPQWVAGLLEAVADAGRRDS